MKTLRLKIQVMKMGLTLGLVTSLGVTHLSSAGVSLENGNFFMQYVDLRYPSGLEVEIRRVFNSKNTLYRVVWFWMGKQVRIPPESLTRRERDPC